MPYSLLSIYGCTLVRGLPLLSCSIFINEMLSLAPANSKPRHLTQSRSGLRRLARTLGRPRAARFGQTPGEEARSLGNRPASGRTCLEPRMSFASLRLGPRDEGAAAPVVPEARG
jgi:hypothetical protein